jgi:hypothetical protein
MDLLDVVADDGRDVFGRDVINYLQISNKEDLRSQAPDCRGR